MAESTPTSAAPLRIVAGADDFGCSLKDAVLSHIRTAHPHIQLLDLSTGPYYSIAEKVARHVSTTTATTGSSDVETRGLVVCGTGTGVSIFANKYPRVYAATCSSVADALNARSINSSNVLCLSGLSTSPDQAAIIFDAWLRTPFKAPCPAAGDAPWPQDISNFLDNSLSEMARIPSGSPSDCSICALRKSMEFEKVPIMPGAEMKIVRESPTSAIVRFERGSVEPAHRHTFGHDVVVMKGRKKVWNLSKGESFELGVGDYLYTPAGDSHRVKYFEDTEFFIRWDGDWDIFLDEDLDAAHGAIRKELPGDC